MSKGDATRQRLLDAAAAEAAEHGLAVASINRIARSAGLQPGSVYFHFDSKDELMGAMLQAGLEETLRHLHRELDALDDDASAAQRLTAAIRAHLGALHELSDYARVVLSLTTTPLPVDAPHRQLLEQYVAERTGIVADAQAAGVISEAPDTRLARDLILGALNQTITSVGAEGRTVPDITSAVVALLQCIART
jgi:AcrR family transcriptional regulator